MAQNQESFANLANVAVTESAANTLTFQRMESGAGIFEKVAMIIHRIEYDPPSSTINLLLAPADFIEIAWSTTNQITGLAKDKAQIVDRIVIAQAALGSPADFQMYDRPWVHNFADLPGGGIIVPAANLYLAIQGTSLASACYCRSSLYFTYRSLKPEEYWELVEATRALS